MKGLPEPSSAFSIASTFARSIAMFSMNLLKPGMKAQWMVLAASRRAGSQGLRLAQIAAMDGHPLRLELRGIGVIARQAQHLMTRGLQLLDDRRADETTGAGQENTHVDISKNPRRQLCALPISC